MKIGDIAKLIGRNVVVGAKIAQPIVGGGGILGGVLGAIVFAGEHVDKSNEEKKAIALAKLARENPGADLEKLSHAVDLQIAAMNAMKDAASK